MSKPRWNNEITPYPFQDEGVEFFIKTPKSINADEAGAGKTLQALKSIVDRGLTPLIICPTHLTFNWKSEIKKYVIGDTSRWKMGTYSQTTPFDIEGCDSVLMDESAYIKTPTAQRTQKVVGTILEAGFEVIHLLNASPIKNRVPDLYPQLWLLSESFRRRFPSYDSFGSYFCNLKNGYQGHVRYDGIREDRLLELKAILKPLMIRRKIDKLVGLPEKTNKKVMVSYGEDPELEREWQKHLNGSLGRDSTAKKRSAISKAPFTAKYVADLVMSGSHPVVVFSDHFGALEVIHKELSDSLLRCRVIDGSVDVDDRAEYVREMQNNEIEVLLCTIPCFKDGWNGTAARHMIFNDICWSSEDLYQASRRILRIGQFFPVFYHFIIGSKVDDAIINTVSGKQETIHKVLN